MKNIHAQKNIYQVNSLVAFFGNLILIYKFKSRSQNIHLCLLKSNGLASCLFVAFIEGWAVGLYFELQIAVT